MGEPYKGRYKRENIQLRAKLDQYETWHKIDKQRIGKLKRRIEQLEYAHTRQALENNNG